MDEIKVVLDALEQNDLVLLDTNVFSEESQGEGLCEKLYEVRRPKNLTPLAEDISKLKTLWQQYYDNIIRHPKIRTTPSVLKEMKDFAGIIQDCYQWHSGFYGPELKNGEGNRRLSNRERVLKRMAEERGITRNDVPQALEDLGTLSTLMQKTIRDIKIYNEKTVPISRRYNGASDADYSLVEAAMGYMESHPEEKVEIISFDKNIPQIIRGYLFSQVIELTKDIN